MDQPRRPSSLLLRAVPFVLLAVLTISACGIGDDGSTVNASDGKGGSSSTSEPGMRKPKSLCERISLKTVEGATRLKLDPGNPSERYNYPECTWRQRGKSVVVTVTLQAETTPDDFDRYSGEDAEEIPDLGDKAYWAEDAGRVSVLSDEGALDVIIYNYDVAKSAIRDGGITIARTILETTEVPDTTTTTASTTPAEPEGLCARVSIDTVEKAAGTQVEPGIPDEGKGADAVDKTCLFRERTDSTVVELELFDSDSFDMDVLTDVEDNDEAGVPAKLQLSSWVIYAETTEGVLQIQILNTDQTDDEFRTSAITLLKEFLASA